MAAPTVISQKSTRSHGSVGAKIGRNYPADTAHQRCMEQQCNKETATRLKWHSSNLLKDSSTDEVTTSRQSEVFRKRILAGCPKPAAWLQEVKDNYRPPPSFHHRTGAFEPSYPPLTDSDNIQDALDMIPADAETKERLYVGLSCENRGRYDYLRERTKLNPEHKYHVPITNSLEYGWGLDDVIERKDVKKPEHARTKLMQESFYRRTGIPTLHVPPTE